MRIRALLRRPGYFLVVGLLATVTMDITALLIVKTGAVELGPYRVVPELLGRWVGSFAQGRFVHATVLDSPPVHHERLLGLVSHYLIGITLTSILLWPHVQIWRRRISLRTAVLYGLTTCACPWLLMFPAMGFGILALKLPHPFPLLLFSTLNHTSFGTGIFFWSRVIPISKSHLIQDHQDTLGATTSLQRLGPARQIRDR